MTFTTHGHHIPGSGQDLIRPRGKTYCGGIGVCVQCSKELAMWVTESVALGKLHYDAPKTPLDPEAPIEPVVDKQTKARILVMQYYNNKPTNAKNQIGLDDVYVVWYTKTLQNWKAVLGIKDPKDERIYEVTYNGSEAETYLDAYLKEDNVGYQDN